MKRRLTKKLLCLLLSGALMVTGYDIPTVHAAETETVSQEPMTDSIERAAETEISVEEQQTEDATLTEEQQTESKVTDESEFKSESETKQEGGTAAEEQQTETAEENTEKTAENNTEPASDEETETQTQEETTELEITAETDSPEAETYSLITVNPLYEGIIDADALAAELDSLRSQNLIAAQSTSEVFESFDAAADYLRGQMVARETTVTVQVLTSVVDEKGTPNDFYKKLFAAATEHTEDCSGQEGDALAWVYGGSKASISSGSETSTFTLTISYYTTYAQEQELTTKVNSALDSLALEGQTDYQKIKAIHDYICDHVDYDYANLNNSSYLLKYSAYAALCRGTAVCQGYAVLFYRMCKEAGLPVRVITGIGNGGNHAWNIVKLSESARTGGRYYNIDCTWDGQDSDTYHTYFLLNEADFADHTRDDAYNTAEFHAQYPMADTSYIDESQFEAALNQANPTFSFTTVDGATVSSAADGKPKLIIFFRTTCGNSQSTIAAISGHNFPGVDIYATEIDKSDRTAVTNFKNTYGNDNITFLYDTADGINASLFQYAQLGGLTNGNSMSVSLPVLCYIDANNQFQFISQGLQNASAIEANLNHYCNVTPVRQYKITYVLNGGTNHSGNPATYSETSATIILQDPTKTGYTFDGWFLDAAFTQKITQIESGRSGSITLYAKWTVNAASDKLNLDNPECELITIDGDYLDTTAGGKPKLLIFFSVNCGNSINTIRGITQQELPDVDIYAIDIIHSTKESVTAFKNQYGNDSITFFYDTLMGNINALNAYTDAANHENITPPIICYIDADNKLQRITNGYSSADTIRANIDAYCNTASGPSPTETYTITYVLNGGTNSPANPAVYTPATDTIVLQNPTRNGYTFAGWYRDAALTQIVTQIPKGSSGNLTLYAKWESITQEPEDPSGFPQVDMTLTEGNILMGISGSYETKTAETILKRLNDIRMEACKEGVIDPNTNKALTEADYKPLKWSSDLEAIARLRAAEASVNLAHTRPNGKSCFTARTTSGEQSWAENLAWNYDGLMKGIEQWYGEKTDWVNQTGEETGHYESIISTRYNYVAVSAFKLKEGFIYPVTVAQEFSSRTAMDSQKSDVSGSCVQDMEIAGSAVSKLTFESNSALHLEAGSSHRPALNATADFTAYGKQTVCTGPVLGGGTWKSSDDTVAAVDANGNITAVKSGTATIRVTAGTVSAEITVQVFNKGENPLQLTKPSKTTYKTGESLDLSGASVTFEGTATALTQNMVSGFQSDTAGITTVTVTYKEYMTTFDTLIVEEPKLTAEYGQTLSQLTLPANEYGKWSWADDDLPKKLDEVGTQKWNVSFTPYDLNTFSARTDLQAEVTVYRSLEDMGVTAELPNRVFVYNGAYREPGVTVMAGDQTLVPDEDYTLIYQNNKNAGTGTVIVEGKGSYSGSIVRTFEIQPAKLVITAKNTTAAIGSVPTTFDYETSGLVIGESLVAEPKFTFNVPNPNEAGIYEIIPGGAKATPNYDSAITYVNGRLIIAEEPVAYVVTFDVQGHGKAPGQFVGSAGAVVTPPEQPMAEGYTFIDWYQDAACTKIWNFETDILQSDLTLYAKWLMNSSSHSFRVQEISDMYYTGKPCKPAVSVYDGSTLLRANKDYKISYHNNTNANAALKTGNGAGSNFNASLPYVTVTGKGNYKEQFSVNFNILPAPIADKSKNPVQGVTLKYKDQIAVSAKKNAAPFQSIKYGKAMQKGVDFEVSVKTADASKVLEGGVIPAGMTGCFTLEITGTGNYTGTIRRTIYVLEPSKLMKNAKITLGKNIKSVALKDYQDRNHKVELRAAYYDRTNNTYYRVENGRPTSELTADEQKNYFTVTCGGESLIYQKDFTVDYDHNDKAGTASMTIIGTGDRFAGEKSVSFKITGDAFKANTVTVEGLDPERTFTGTAITQNSVKLTYTDNEPLLYGKDYTISYKKNVNKGTATMTFAAMDGSLYSGSFSKTFKILPADISAMEPNASTQNIKVPYEKAGAKPAAKIVLRNPAGAVLQYGRDYTVSYQNNKSVATAADGAAAPTMRVKGKGNYTGTSNIYFTITLGCFDDKNITIDIAPIAYNPQKTDTFEYKPSIKVKDGKSSLKAAKDYEITYLNNDQNACTSYMNKIKSGDPVSPNEKPCVIITPTSDSNYDPQQPANILLPVYWNKLTASTLYVVPDTTETVYTGKQVRPSIQVYYNSDSTAVAEAKKRQKNGTPMSETELLKNGFQLLQENEDYTCSYGTNISAGKNKGSVTIRGAAPNYGSTVTVKFEITRKTILW